MIEKFVERLFFASRWLVAPVYLGLSLALIALGVKFFDELWHVFTHLRHVDFTEADPSEVVARFGPVTMRMYHLLSPLRSNGAATLRPGTPEEELGSRRDRPPRQGTRRSRSGTTATTSNAGLASEIERTGFN